MATTHQPLTSCAFLRTSVPRSHLKQSSMQAEAGCKVLHYLLRGAHTRRLMRHQFYPQSHQRGRREDDNERRAHKVCACGQMGELTLSRI
jgi:hypothetical protein